MNLIMLVLYILFRKNWLQNIVSVDTILKNFETLKISSLILYNGVGENELMLAFATLVID